MHYVSEPRSWIASPTADPDAADEPVQRELPLVGRQSGPTSAGRSQLPDGVGPLRLASPTSRGRPYLWLPACSPIGNHPEAVANAAGGKLFFPVAQTASSITMAYDNVGGDVHYKWADGGQK